MLSVVVVIVYLFTFFFFFLKNLGWDAGGVVRGVRSSSLYISSPGEAMRQCVLGTVPCIQVAARYSRQECVFSVDD